MGRKHPPPGNVGSISRAIYTRIVYILILRGGKMFTRTNGRVFDCVTVDLNTQRDFCVGDGAFPVANLAELIPALRRVVAWVKRNQVPTIASIESHREWELSDSGNPIHCVDGSDGQEKLDFTLLANRTYVRSDNTLTLPIDLFMQYQQVIFWKRADDLLTNPKADRMLTQLETRQYLLFGVGIETSIKALALALLARRKRVTVVADASGYWSRGTADLAIRQIVAKGARLTTVDELLSRKLDRRVRYSPIPGLVRSSHAAIHRGFAAPSNGRVRNGPGQTRLPLSPINANIPKRNGASPGVGP
jgi:nicotinamidase-related amidase